MDELERLRQLAGAAPAPDPQRKAEARERLLAMAEAEAAEEAAAASATGEHREADPAREGSRVWFRGVLRRWFASPVPAFATAAAALLAVIAVGGIVFDPFGEPAPPEVAVEVPDEPEMLEEPAPEEEAEPEAEVGPEADEEPVLARSCTDPDGRYHVGYPDDWHTASDDAGACVFFDEEPIEVDEAVGGQPPGSIGFVLEASSIDELATVGVGAEERERDEVDVEGRAAVRQLLESTGEGALPEGALTYRYLVDLGDETLVASAYAQDGAELEDRRAVLDAMVDTLELEDP